MGTRSDIIVHLSSGKWARIYCHWDGYLSHNGQLLNDHYASQELAEALIALGDLSSLNEEIGVKHPFDAPDIVSQRKAYDDYQTKYGRMCRAYGRDRGEKNVAARIGDTLSAVWPEADTWTEFTYVWHNGQWWVGDPDEGSQAAISLKDALDGKTALTPSVKVFGATVGRHAPVSGAV